MNIESDLVMSSNNFDKKCGVITFCLQVDKRVYALNCLFCQEICSQWDTFITHMELKHSEELNDDFILVAEDYETELPEEFTINLKMQDDACESINNVDNDTNRSFLSDPLEEKNVSPKFVKVKRMEVSTDANSNSPVLNEDLNDDNNNNGFLRDEIPLQSSLFFKNDKSNKETILCDEIKLTELLIQYYKQHTILWQTNSSDNKNIRKHQKAYKDITNLINKEMNLNLNCTQIKEKIHKLKSRFRKEQAFTIGFSVNSYSSCDKNEIEYAHLSTTSNKTQLVSSFYEKMSFLKDYINGDSKKQSKQGSKALTSEKCHLPLAAFSLEENQKFIELYKSYPCLWDINHIGYRFKSKRQESLQELLEAVNTQFNIYLSTSSLQKKLYSIRYAFTQEKHRQIKDKQDFTPQCKMYNELLFLKDSVGPFQCEYCEQIFNGPDQYKVHKSTHDGSMPYTCPECKKGFMNVGNCTVHLRRHTKDFQFECGECGKKFATSTDYNVHLRRHTGEKPYFCDICGQSFRTWTHFDAHKRRHEKNKTHKCSMCLKSFYENAKLKDHMKTHLNVRDKVCNVCGKSFTCTKHLNQHKLTHAETKKYSCKLCGKKFAQPGGLSNHTKSHGMIANSSITLINSEFRAEVS